METTRNPLGYEPVGKLLRKFAVPSIISMVVSTLYNIVDQIFYRQRCGLSGQRCNQRHIAPNRDCRRWV